MNQLEILICKNIVTKIKTTLGGFNISLDIAEEQICKLEARFLARKKDPDERENKRQIRHCKKL